MRSDASPGGVDARPIGEVEFAVFGVEAVVLADDVGGGFGFDFALVAFGVVVYVDFIGNSMSLFESPRRVTTVRHRQLEI